MRGAKQVNRYYGAAADAYDRSREGTRAWAIEQKAVASFLESVATEGLRCLDVPVGTGRFLDLYEDHGISAVGTDISVDMLTNAIAKAEGLSRKSSFARGSIFDLPYQDAAFDIVVCYRLLNWLSPDEAEQALAELRRVSRRWILFSIRQRVSTLRSWAAEQKRAIVRARGRPASFGHKESRVLEGLHRLGLKVVSRAMLNERKGFMEHVGWVAEVSAQESDTSE